MVGRDWGVQNRELLFNGYRVSDQQDEKGLNIFHNNVNTVNTIKP